MKYLVVLVSGPTFSLSSPDIQKDAPHVKRLLDEGYSGKMHAGTNVATQDEFISILPVLGYDSNRCYNGEGSLLAARAGVHLEKDDVAFCCDLVTLKHPQEGYFFQKFGPKVVLEHFSDETIEDEVGKELIREINAELGTESIVFYPVRNHAHLMVWVGGKPKLQTAYPGEVSGKSISPFLPKGDGANTLIRCMEVASQFLQQHPLNEERIAQEKAPVNGIWFSRPGRAMELPTWKELYNLRGALIAEEGMIQGIGQLAGLTLIETPENENMPLKERCQARAKGVIKNFAGEDFVFVHLTAGENGHEFSLPVIDQFFLQPILEHLNQSGDWKILLLESPSFADFPRKIPFQPIDKEISFLISAPGLKKKTGILLKEGFRLMPRFIKGGAWE